ncbi:hypothetical protein MBLNU459_g5773t1 [Dothideomycetes sp. NU459]
MRLQSAVAAALLGLAATAYAADQTTLSDLPNLSTATEATTKKTASSASASASATATDSDSSAAASSSSGSSAASTASSASTTGSSASTTGSATSSNNIFHLTGLPTIAGAGVPTLVIPYTADAPFMQKSGYPEGTVFICIGAILGFLGACVLAWRGMTAWTINRSVKRAALASIMASDAKAPGWMTGNTKYGPGGKLYSAPAESFVSLEALTATGKTVSSTRHASNLPPLRKDHSRDPSALFFSPTAQPGPNSAPMSNLGGNRASTYLPAGYYASPSAQAAGGAASTTIGGYGRSSPPESPAPSPHRPGSTHLRAPSSRDNSRTRNSWAAGGNSGGASGARNSSMLNPTHAGGAPVIPMYSQPSTSSLIVGNGHDDNLPGMRAPSAVFDDLLENHGHGPRERY